MKKQKLPAAETVPTNLQDLEPDFPMIPDDIRTFLNESGIADKGYTVYLYRCALRVGAGQKTRSFVNQFDNFLPSFREIGEEYGAGSYEMYIRWYDIDGKSGARKVIVNLDASFDQVRDTRERKKKEELDRAAGARERGGDPAGSATNAMMQGVLMIKALSEAVAPILRPLISGKTAQDQQPDNFAGTMKTLQEMGSSMLMDNFKQGLNMQRELMANMPAGSDIDKEDSALEKMLSALDRLIPLFKTLSDKQIKPIAQTAVDQSQEIQELLSDPVRLKITNEKLIEKYGTESANRIMKAFGARPIHSLRQAPDFDPGGNGGGQGPAGAAGGQMGTSKGKRAEKAVARA